MKARALMFGVPWNPDNQLFLDRVISDLDIFTKFCLQQGIEIDTASLYDGNARKGEILRRIHNFLHSDSATSEPCIRLIVYAGHGRDELGDWMCCDGDVTFEEIFAEVSAAYEKENQTQTVLNRSQAYLQATASKATLSQTLIIADCCFSGMWAEKYFQKVGYVRGQQDPSAESVMYSALNGANDLVSG